MLLGRKGKKIINIFVEFNITQMRNDLTYFELNQITTSYITII